MDALQGTESAKDAIQRVSYSHDAMIDIIIAKPDVTGDTLATHFGYSRGWVSRILCSDAFQARLAKRRTEIVNPTLVANFEERLKGLAARSLDVIMEKLDKVDEVTGLACTATAFKALELSAKSLGYGARQTNVAIQNNLTVKTASDEQLMAIAMGEGK